VTKTNQLPPWGKVRVYAQLYKIYKVDEDGNRYYTGKVLIQIYVNAVPGSTAGWGDYRLRGVDIDLPYSEQYGYIYEYGPTTTNVDRGSWSIGFSVGVSGAGPTAALSVGYNYPLGPAIKVYDKVDANSHFWIVFDIDNSREDVSTNSNLFKIYGIIGDSDPRATCVISVVFTYKNYYDYRIISVTFEL